MESVCPHQVFDVPVAPVLEETRISVLALCIYPHIETLCHYHHTKRVAYVHLNLRRHIMGCADSIASHSLQKFYLTNNSSLVHSSTQQSEVVVQTNTLNLTALTIQCKSLFSIAFHSAETDFLHLAVKYLTLAAIVVYHTEFHSQVVQRRIFGRPTIHTEICSGGCSLTITVQSHQSRDILIAYPDSKFKTQELSAKADCLCAELFNGNPIVGTNTYRVGSDAPFCNGTSACLNQFYRTEQSCARIPTTALLHILQVYCQCVGLAVLIHKLSDIHIKGVISVLPLACLLAVNIHLRFCHSSVEIQYGTNTVLIYSETGAIPSTANPWQRTTASGLLRSFLLSVLLYGYHLLVNLLVERSCDCPIVRNTHFLPIFIVELGLCSISSSHILRPRESPAIPENGFLSVELGIGIETTHKQCSDKHRFIQIRVFHIFIND